MKLPRLKAEFMLTYHLIMNPNSVRTPLALIETSKRRPKQKLYEYVCFFTEKQCNRFRQNRMDPVKESNIFRTATGEKETGLDENSLKVEFIEILLPNKSFFNSDCFNSFCLKRHW